MHISASFKAELNSINFMYVAHLFEKIATLFGSLLKPSSYSFKAAGNYPFLKSSFPFCLCSSAFSGSKYAWASFYFFTYFAFFKASLIFQSLFSKRAYS